MTTPAPGPILFRDATIVTLAEGRPDVEHGDLLVADGRVAAIGVGMANDSATPVDARGMLLMPGFVDGHRHCWQGSLRRLIPDADLPEYMAVTHDGVARHYRPEDMEIGDTVALLGALDSGFTTVVDLSHNSRSRAHSDAVLRAYERTGIRAVHASAPPNAGEWEGLWPDDLDRLSATIDAMPLVTLRMAIDMRRVRPVEELLAFARSRGLAITMDGVMGAGSSEELTRLGADGLLGPDITLIHATSLTESAWQAILSAGVRIVLATTSDEQLGLAGGYPPVQRVMDGGIRPGLSVDVEIALAGDPFTQMRATLLTQRMAATAEKMAGGPMPRRLGTREVLDWAISGGAESAGLAATIGSLAPGMAADLLLVDLADAVVIPAGDPIATIVHGIDRASIRGVLVGGAVRKWDGRLVGVDLAEVADRAERSRSHLLERAGFSLDASGLAGVPELQDAYLRDYLGGHDDRV